MASAIVRVKRRINEEPLSAFVLNCKKPKLDNVEDENLACGGSVEAVTDVSTILKFAGTVETQNADAVTDHISRLSKDDARQLAQKSRNPNITEKSRQEMRQNLHESRFKVVNCHRTMDTNEIENPKEITIVDIEKQQKEQKESQVPMFEQHAPTDSDGFVYDLYVPDQDQHLPENVDYMDHNISVKPFDDLIYEDHYTDEDDCDSQDSNQENYFTNDYPDEDGSYYSVDEDDIKRAVNEIDLDGDRELSSDYEDTEGFVLTKHNDENDFGTFDTDDEDEEGDGFRLRNYYAKMHRKPINKENDDDADSEESSSSDAS